MSHNYGIWNIKDIGYYYNQVTSPRLPIQALVAWCFLYEHFIHSSPDCFYSLFCNLIPPSYIQQHKSALRIDARVTFDLFAAS